VQRYDRRLSGTWLGLQHSNAAIGQRGLYRIE
jgi:hypothetical protein